MGPVLRQAMRFYKRKYIILPICSHTDITTQIFKAVNRGMILLDLATTHGSQQTVTSHKKVQGDVGWNILVFSGKQADFFSFNAVHPCPSTVPFRRKPNRRKHELSQTDLVHLADESVDVLLTVAQVTTLDEVLELAGAEATVGVGQLEGPQEVGGLLEVGADGVDLVDQILDTDDAVLAEVLLNDGVVGKGDTLLVDLSVSTLVDELLDALQVGVTVGDPGLDDLDHLGDGLGDTDEDTVVDLQQTEQLEDLAGLGGDLVDTARLVSHGCNQVGLDESKTYPLIRTMKINLASAGT